MSIFCSITSFLILIAPGSNVQIYENPFDIVMEEVKLQD